MSIHCTIRSFIEQLQLKTVTKTKNAYLHEMAETKSATGKKVGEPAIFVYANNQTNFEHQIDLKFTVLNVNKIESNENLTSPTFFVQSLPFHIVIEHEKRKSSKKGNKIDKLQIQLIVGQDNQDQWSSKFSVNFHSNEVRDLQKFIESELSDTKCTISHTIEWDAVSELKVLYFQIHIDAEQPNGGYEWPSREATGYNGIVNEGATCYINCLFQSLYFTNEFRRLIYGTPIESEDVNDSFLFWLKYIFYALQFNRLPKITTKNMIKCFNWAEMNETSHQDVQEFLRLLMDKIEQFVDGTEFKQRLNDLFVGTMKSTITCKNSGYSTSKNETFWDIPLPIDESPNIYGAFGVFLDAITINDYRCGDGAKAEEALQEFEIIKWPPVLHIHLKRFGFDAASNSLKKNNKRFEFYPQLNLSQYGADAVYTLHSVLVHSGSLHSGHYIAFICPKADNQWFKFNDEIVTKCSADDAIQENYGNNYRSTNAYMLVYIKTSRVQDILRDVSEQDVDSKALIEREVTKEIEELANQHKFIETIVFTSDILQNSTNLKKGRNLFDPNRGLSFHIEKEKNLSDLYDLLRKELRVNEKHSLALWMVNIKKDSVRACDTQSYLDKPLNKLCKKDCVHFYVEVLSREDPAMVPFQKNKHALIFIKEYDSMSKRLKFHMHRYFMLNETVADLQAFIKNHMEYDGDADDIAIMVEKGAGEQYNCREFEEKYSIGKIAPKFGDIQSAQVVFEIIEQNHGPKYIQIAFGQNSTKQEHAAAIEKIENGIHVDVKNDDTGESYVDREFSPSDQLLTIVDLIGKFQNCTHDSIQLLDTEKNIIDVQFQHYTLEAYLAARNENCRTRGKKQKNLVFSFKMVHSGQPMEIDSTNHSNGSSTECGVPMKCSSPQMFGRNSMEFESNSMSPINLTKEEPDPPVVPEITDVVELLDADEPAPYTVPVRFFNATTKLELWAKKYAKNETIDQVMKDFARANELNINNVVFTDQKDGLLEAGRRSLELCLDCDQTELIIYFEVEAKRRTTSIKRAISMSRPSNTNQRPKLQLYLTFKDQTATRDPMDIDFDDSVAFSVAIDRIVDVMDLDRSKTHFFNLKGEEITDFRGTVSKYSQLHSATVEYKMVDRSVFNFRMVNHTGLDCGVHSTPINKSTTIGDICAKYDSKHMQMVRMKDGLIQEIVTLATKVAKLIGDGCTYRLDLYPTSRFLRNEKTFHVCVKFIGSSPAERKQTPLLVEVQKGQSLGGLGLLIVNNLGIPNVAAARNFQYLIDGKHLQHDHKLIEPKNPKSIQVISLDMNESKFRKPTYSYKNFKD